MSERIRKRIHEVRFGIYDVNCEGPFLEIAGATKQALPLRGGEKISFPHAGNMKNILSAARSEVRTGLDAKMRCALVWGVAHYYTFETDRAQDHYVAVLLLSELGSGVDDVIQRMHDFEAGNDDFCPDGMGERVAYWDEIRIAPVLARHATEQIAKRMNGSTPSF